MALLWSDGFDKYSSTGADLNIRYTRSATAISVNTTGGVTGGGAAISSDGVSRRLEAAFTSAHGATETIRAAFWFRSAISAGTFFRIGTNQQALNSSFAPGINMLVDGSVSVTIHGGTTVLATSAAGVIIANQYHHIEYAGRYRDSGGSIVVKVDGVTVINFSGDANTGTQPTSIVGVCPFWSDSSNRFDDLLVWDDAGSDFTSALSVLHQIETLDVDADDSVQFTPLSSTNTSNVDDATFHDGDTTYNESATVGHVDLFTVEDQATTPANTLAVVVHTRAKKTDAGSAVLRNRLVVGATTSEGSDNTLTTSYTHKQDAWGKNPSTSAAWSNTDVNSIKSGYEFQA